MERCLLRWLFIISWLACFPAAGFTCYGVNTAVGDVSDDLQNLFRHVVMPVLDEGARSGTYEFSPATGTVVITGEHSETKVRFTYNREEAYPKTGLPEVKLKKGRAYSEVVLYVPDVHRDALWAQGLVRSAFRAELHPHLRPKNWVGKFLLSFPQSKALGALLGMENRATDRGLKLGLFDPVGLGKTVVSSKYVSEVGRWNRSRNTPGWKKKPKVLFVVESESVLARTGETYQRELEILEEKTARIYGEGSRYAISEDAELILITRSSYEIRREEVHRLLGLDADQPWVVVFDEAQHLGREGGDFSKILSDLEAILDGRHRVLLLSATLWHPEKALITEYLKGNIYGSFLTKPELDQLAKGENLPELCRAQYYRAMQAGYLAPLMQLSLIRNIDGIPVSEMLQGVVLDHEAARRHIRTYPALLQDLAARVMAARIPGQIDRGVIYVDSQARADIYAAELSRLLGDEVRPLHSGDGVNPNTLAWFSDRGSFANQTNRRKRKYIVVVDMLKEGVDIPEINLVVLLRQYGDDMAGFRGLIQHLGRGARQFAENGFFKSGLRVLDYALYTKWLKGGLTEISVEPRSSTHNKNPFNYITIDDKLYTPLQFIEEFLDLSFVEQFPYFDLETFQQGALRALHELAPSYAVEKFSTDFGPKELLLKIAALLPECSEKTVLLKELADDAIWGWQPGDGSYAKQTDSASEPSHQRIYRALHRIARIASLHPDGAHLSLFEIQSAPEVEKLMDFLDPMRVKSLIDKEHRTTFVDKEKGAWEVLAREMEERRLGKVSDTDGLGLLMRTLAADIPDETAKVAALKRLETDLVLNPTDGLKMNSKRYVDEQTELKEGWVRVRGPLQRTYRALYLIALSLKTCPGGEKIDLTRLHEKEQVETVLNLLNPERIGVHLNDTTRPLFLSDEAGFFPLLAERAPSFGVPSYNRNFGTRELAIGIAEHLREGKERDSLIEEFRDPKVWDWGEKDGKMIRESGYSNPTDLFYRALAKVASLYNRQFPERPVDLTLLHTVGEGRKFLDFVTLGFEIPVPTPATLVAFEAKVAPLMETVAKDAGIRAYVTNFGPKRLAQKMAAELVEKFPGDFRVEKLQAALANDVLWRWNKLDGDMLKAKSSERARESALRALSAIQALHYDLSGWEVPPVLHNVREATNFFKLFACLAI